MWLRLVVGGGLIGAYGAVAGGVALGGLGLAVLALIVGWFYSRQLGALYDFDRAPLRQTTGEEAS